MREALMRLVALAALAAAGDMLAPSGSGRQAVRFIGGLLTACALMDLAANLGEIIGL